MKKIILFLLFTFISSGSFSSNSVPHDKKRNIELKDKITQNKKHKTKDSQKNDKIETSKKCPKHEHTISTTKDKNVITVTKNNESLIYFKRSYFNNEILDKESSLKNVNKNRTSFANNKNAPVVTFIIDDKKCSCVEHLKKYINMKNNTAFVDIDYLFFGHEKIEGVNLNEYKKLYNYIEKATEIYYSSDN